MNRTGLVFGKSAEMVRTAGFVLFLVLSLIKDGHTCTDPASAYRFTGIVCRLTYPAAVVLNEKTTEVIQAAFQHAKYPSVQSEKSSFMGTVKYGVQNLEIYNLTIGKSEFELRNKDGITINIAKVSAVFKGVIKYGYISTFFFLNRSVDFEVETEIDLVINAKLNCGKGRVAADTSNCYLTFHKLNLMLQGDREPGWMKKLFTELITFTVKMVVKGQICKEINKVADILADFIQDTAEQFLADGDISVDIDVTSAPVITSNYIESYHKGLVTYKHKKSSINASSFEPHHISEDRSLYFWLSDNVLDSMMTTVYEDGRFHLNLSGTELMDLFHIKLSTSHQLIEKWLLLKEPLLKAWSFSAPHLWTTPQGTTVRAVAALELRSAEQDSPALYFETEVEVLVRASYAEKKVLLNATAVEINVSNISISFDSTDTNKALNAYLHEAVEKLGIPKVISYLEPKLTGLMDQQGLNLFDLINPEVIPQNGYVLIQMDFGFPQHLLVDFLQRMLV